MRKKFYKLILCCLFFCLGALVANGQERRVTGVVTDQGGITLPGVTIAVKGTSTKTVTDAKGKFSITVPSGSNVLVFSFIGMQNREITLSPNKHTLEVSLQNAPRDLNEVVVVGYGTTKKRDLTGSVGQIKGSDLIKTPAANVDGLLQGKVPGLQVISSSGQPGAGATIRIRGLGSRSDANPLVVVDGLPLGDAGSIKQINPDDIESVEVLKDASSAAIYGSRGANGVILITTKKGKAGEARITFSSLNTVSTLANKLDVFHDPVEAAAIDNEARINGGQPPLFIGQVYGGTYYPPLAELRGLDLWGLTYDYKLKVRNRMKVLCMSISLDAGG